MSSELLTYLRAHIERVVQDMALSELVLGTVITKSTDKKGLTVQLVDSKLVISKPILLLSDHLTNFVTTLQALEKWRTSASSPNSHTHSVPRDTKSKIEVKLWNGLNVGDMVLLAKIYKGRYYVILTRVVGCS